jgi:hypothetical protein
MSGEVSYFSRFFARFVEIVAAGLASAISAYLLAHFGGLLSSPTPASAPVLTHVQVEPTASEVAAKPIPPGVSSAASEQPASQQDAAAKAGKDPKVSPPRKHTKTDTSVAEKEPRSHKSAEALVRDALANFDTNWRVPADTLIGSGPTDTPSVQVDNAPSRQANVPLHQPDVGPRPNVPPRRASVATSNADNVPLPVQPPSAPRSDLRPRSPDIRSAPPSANSLEIAEPRPMPQADQDKDAFSALKRLPDVLRPDRPATSGEPPRPPMPIGTAPPE